MTMASHRQGVQGPYESTIDYKLARVNFLFRNVREDIDRRSAELRVAMAEANNPSVVEDEEEYHSVDGSEKE